MNLLNVTIPAAVNNQAGTYSLQASGKFFVVTATDGTFRVHLTNGQEYTFQLAGQGFGDEQEPTFGKLQFYNDSGSDVHITVYIGAVPLKTTDASISTTVNVTATLSNVMTGLTLVQEQQFVKTTTGAAVALTAGVTYFRRAIIIAQKDLNQTANTGKVYIGVAAGNQPIALNPGDVWTIQEVVGAKFNFQNWYLSADNSGDGVAVIYG